MSAHIEPSSAGRESEVTRRAFLQTTLAGGAALLAGGLPSLLRGANLDLPFTETNILELQRGLQSGQWTSASLTDIYLRRIARLNPLLHAVIETNPDALDIAAQRDGARAQGRTRGPLDGVPVLVKDNLATADKMQTTAGSLALVDSVVPADSVVVQKLRNAGAVILGKANLSEWANFRGFAPFNGWSARGGFTRDPYLLNWDPCGSSSGSAAAAAAFLCAAAIGTETDGSIVCPSGNNLCVGLKPSIGLVSQDGIIPIAHSQDTAGPICRTVTDAAVLLGIIQTPMDGVPPDYTVYLKRGALEGARIGMDKRYFTRPYGGELDLIEVVRPAIDVMRSLGATVVVTDTGDSNLYFNAEFTVLLFEFKVQIAEYLAGLTNTSIATLADLIQFDLDHCPQEMKYFGQEIFELAEATSGDLTDPEYLAARALCLQLSRDEGIDAALERDDLDAIIAPSYSFASSPAAVAGYPNISIPVGLTAKGKPAGIWMYGGYLQEAKLLSYAYDLEQEIQPRSAPQFIPPLPHEPPDAGICTMGAPARTLRRHLPYHLGTGKHLPR
ncbi:MAG TPA: amidase family protein [Chthoniobacterales bacterium]|jgi:amidase|nr:amidase family protein [Chthoniobacterales bacterium]